MKCEDLYAMAIEEYEANLFLFDRSIITGVFIKNHWEIARFISNKCPSLLSPTVLMIITLDIEFRDKSKICSLYGKKCVSNAVKDKFKYYVSWGLTFMKRLRISFLRFWLSVV